MPFWLDSMNTKRSAFSRILAAIARNQTALRFVHSSHSDMHLCNSILEAPAKKCTGKKEEEHKRYRSLPVAACHASLSKHARAAVTAASTSAGPALGLPVGYVSTHQHINMTRNHMCPNTLCPGVHRGNHLFVGWIEHIQKQTSRGGHVLVVDHAFVQRHTIRRDGQRRHCCKLKNVLKSLSQL